MNKIKHNHKLCQLLIKKYLSKDINWPREIKIAQTLTSKYQNYKFWNNLKDFKLPSLAWFLTEDGKNFLALQKKLQELKIKKKIICEIKEEKFGKDKVLQSRPRTLLDFLK